MKFNIPIGYEQKSQTEKIIKDIEDSHFINKKLNYRTHIGLYINKFRMSIFSNVNEKFTKYILCWTIVKTQQFSKNGNNTEEILELYYN